MNTSEKSLKRQIKNALQHKGLERSILQNLKRRGFLDTKEYSTKEIIQEAQELEREFNVSFAPCSPAGKPNQEERLLFQGDDTLELRQRVLSEIYADMADQEKDVIEFRRDVLGDKLMQWGGVEAWLKQREKEEEGLPTKSPPEDWYLDYAVPQDQWRHNVTIRRGGDLERLKKVSKPLSNRYRWQEGQATAFILAHDDKGNPLVPLVSLISARIDNTTDDKTPQSAKWRISMTIDPTLTDKQVAKAYRQVRGKFFRKDAKGRALNRPIKKEALEVAQFFIRQPRGRKASERLNIWNMKHEGDRRYSGRCAAGNLNRDGKDAVDRLLNSGIEPPDLRAAYNKEETESLEEWKRRPRKTNS